MLVCWHVMAVIRFAPAGFTMEAEGGQESTAEKAVSKPADFRADVMSSNFPDLSKHNNWMAHCINKVAVLN